MTEPRLREASERDAPALAEVLFSASYHDGLRAGLRPRIADARAARGYVAHLLGVDALSGVLAESDGQPVAMGWGHLRRRVVTIGPVVVLPEWRGRGIASAILGHLIDRTAKGSAQIRLLDDGSPAALACCLRAGFRVVAPVLELVLPPDRACVVPDLADGVTLREAGRADRDAIVERDARLFGARREQDVEHALAFGRVALAERAGRLTGHAIALALDAELAIGAAGSEDATVLLALIGDQVTRGRAPGATVRLLVPATDQRVVERVMDAGFRIQRSRTYLARGGSTAPPRGYVLMPLGRC